MKYTEALELRLTSEGYYGTDLCLNGDTGKLEVVSIDEVVRVYPDTPVFSNDKEASQWVLDNLGDCPQFEVIGTYWPIERVV